MELCSCAQDSCAEEPRLWTRGLVVNFRYEDVAAKMNDKVEAYLDKDVYAEKNKFHG